MGIIIKTKGVFENPVGLVPGVVDTSRMPKGIGGLYITRVDAGSSGFERIVGESELEEAAANPLLYDSTSVGHEESRDGFIIRDLPVHGEDGITMFFIYQIPTGVNDRYRPLAANVAADDPSNEGAVMFRVGEDGVTETGCRIYLGATDNTSPPPELGLSSTRLDGNFQYYAFGFNVESKDAFISNRYRDQDSSGWEEGNIPGIIPSDNSNDYYIFRDAETGYPSSDRPDRLAAFGWYPRTLSESESNSLAEQIFDLMEKIGIKISVDE